MNFIKDLREDDHIACHYLCKQKLSLKSRNQKTYLSLRLQDKTGMIEAKVWDLGNDIQNFEENEFIRVEGVVLSYQNDLQIKAIKIRRSMSGEYDPSDYIPRTEKDISLLLSQLNAFIASIANQYIKELLANIFLNNSGIYKAFSEHSAAKTMHHSYLGGLLEHTVSVTQICDFLCAQYKNVNRDLLICASLLHDVGKIYELSPFPDNSYTDDGQLLGHVYMGAEMVSKEALMISKFPETLESLIKHCIIAHHGEYEFGSPKLPEILEAYILYCADNMDSKIKAIETALDSENLTKGWTGYNKNLERFLRKTEY